jgi:hypothetical protein
MRRRDYDLTKTFDVLVGKEPNQQRFTVHHDLLVQRSEFFKAARALRWTQADQPTTLEDHDPETFSTYLHCLYFGVDAIKDRLSLVAEQHGSSNKPTINNNESDKDSSSDSHSDSDSASEEGQNEQLSTEVTTQKPPKTLTVMVDGKEKEATAILFVGNLSWITEEKALEQAFEEFGELRGVRIVTSSKDGRSKGFGYVEFTSSESAANALLASASTLPSPVLAPQTRRTKTSREERLKKSQNPKAMSLVARLMGTPTTCKPTRLAKTKTPQLTTTLTTAKSTMEWMMQELESSSSCTCLLTSSSTSIPQIW